MTTIFHSGCKSVESPEGTSGPDWHQLPPIPDPEGFAGCFAGACDGSLIIAGGANITGDKWGDSFLKAWYDSVFILDRPEGSWVKAGKLPHRLGYGVSVTYNGGVICIGGSDENGHYANAFRIDRSGGKLLFTPLPSLPKPCANFCGALLGDDVYVAGGIEAPNVTSALKTFWKLDLKNPGKGWESLAPWPGPERMLAVAGVADGSFYLFSGASLHPGPDGKPARTFLDDCYRYTPGHGWKKLPDMPRPAVAAPSPSPFSGGKLLVMSGDDGTKVDFKPVSQHPGFPRDILSFDVRSETWAVAGPAPFSRATVPTALWNGHIVVPNGEARPRQRTPEVWWSGPAVK